MAALGQRVDVRVSGSRVHMTVPESVAASGEAEVVAVIGVDPLWQPMLAGDHGRVQVLDEAWDPKAGEWFNAFAPVPEAGSWSHWTGRGMTWNSQCADCHNTGVKKGWNDAAGTWDTTLEERGVGCEACHGEAAAHAAAPATAVPVPKPGLDTCLPCHTRRAALTETAKPGDPFLDGFVPLGLADGALYWPDGQVRDEVFEGGSFLGSRMAQVGVTCNDCHLPHSSALVRQGDELCLGCHAALPTFRPHANHPPESEGARCTSCHMPVTIFMQRDPRHDHGFTIPDPALNVAAGVPDACTGCHAEEGAEWAAARVEEWFGAGRRPSRERAAVLAATPPEASALLPLAKSDPHPWWRGTALSLLAELPSGTDLLRASTRDAESIVRLRAVGALTARPRSEALERVFRHALADPLRAVRVQAARGLRRSLDPEAPEAEPLRTWLEANLGQPDGARELGAWQLERGRPAEALLHLQRAAAWDPADVQAKLYLAFANLRLGRRKEAAASLEDCIRVAPQLAEAWLARARLQQEEGDLRAGVDTLERGERAIPTDPRLPRALARAYAEQGLDAAARRAEDRARKVAAP
jgi:predicted CXXCH cytochrome family protein